MVGEIMGLQLNFYSSFVEFCSLFYFVAKGYKIFFISLFNRMELVVFKSQTPCRFVIIYVAFRGRGPPSNMGGYEKLKKTCKGG